MSCVSGRAAQHARRNVTTFSCAKMHGLHSESCRDVTGQVEFGLKQSKQIEQ